MGIILGAGLNRVSCGNCGQEAEDESACWSAVLESEHRQEGMRE